MFLPPGKAMHLRRDVCRWHVSELFCHCEERSDVAISRKGHNVKKVNKNGRRVASVVCDITLICGCR